MAAKGEGVKLRPWDANPYGVVSLLDMLDFSARDYLELSHTMGTLRAGVGPFQMPPEDEVKKMLDTLIKECQRLSLVCTLGHLQAMGRELKGGASLGPLRDRMGHHFETVYSTLKIEIDSVKIKAIPKEKNRFCDPQWLLDTPIYDKFPDSVDEFQRGGRCYAFGENTACVFHLMRVTDFFLRKVAESLGAEYDARNWHGIGSKIEERMREKYQNKTDDWKTKEPFYAEILTDISAIGRGHRNPALHELEKKYDAGEALYMLTVIEGFARHVSSKIKAPQKERSHDQ